MKNTLLDAVATLPRRNTMLDAVNAAPVAEDTYGEAITPYDSELTKALRRSSAGTVSTIQGLGGAVQDLYDHEGAKKVFDEARKRVEFVSRANPAQVGSIKDIHSLSDALAYVPSAFGEMAPTMATATVGGIGGRMLASRFAPKLLEKPLAAELAGGAVGMFPQEAGETAMSLAGDPEAMKNTTPAERLALAAGKGGVNALLESAVPAWTGSKLMGAAAKQAVAKGQALSHIGKTAVQGGLAEGATEGAQELVGGLVHKVANPEHYIDPWDVADAAVKGTIPGHAFGALGGVGDVVHSRLGGVEDAGPQPTKLDRVAEVVGGAAGKVAAKAAGAIERRLDAHLARQDDPDLAFFTRPDDINPNGRSDSELMDMIASDDAARAQAAINYATKVMQRAANSDGVSDEELQAAADFLGAAKNGQLSADAVRQFGDQINNIKRRGNAQSTFVSAAQDLVTPALERKGNAMSVTPESETGRAQQQHQIAKLWLQDMAQINPMFAELDTTDPQVTTAMLAVVEWISNGFSYEKGGKKFLPKSIDALGEAAAPAILSAYKLLRRQGLTDVTDLEALKMAQAIEARQNANRGTLSYVLENFTPLALKSFGSREQAAAMAQQVTTALRQLNDGKLVMTPEADAMLTEYFGPNKARVLKAFRKSQQASAETKLDAEGVQDGTGIEDEANPDIEAQAAQDYETGLNREWSPDTDVVYHGFGKDNKPLSMDFESARRDLLNKRNEVAGANPKSYVREIGVHDMLREQHAGDAEALKRAEDALLEAQGIRLHPKDVEGRRKNLAALNRKYRLIREEVYSDKDEIEVKNVNELKDIEKFKDKKGKLVDVSTVKHGRLYLEQEHIDDETGEITTKPFVTSAAKLIRHASKGVESTKEGAAELHDKLMAGLSALLTAKDGKFTGKVGYKKTAGGDIHWMKPGEELPADFTFFEEGGVSEADAKSQRAEPKLSDDDKRKAVSATAKYLWHYDERKARALFNLLNSSELPIEAIDEAVDTIGAADSSIDSVYDAAMVLRKEAQLAYQQSQEPASDTDPMLGKEKTDRADVVPSEVEEGGNRPIRRDEHGYAVTESPTGALVTGDKRLIVPTLKPQKSAQREDATNKVPSHKELRATEKQFKWIVDTLRKGVPAFIKAVKNATEAQREGIREALIDLRTVDQNDVRLTTAKITDFAAFNKRVEVALRALNGAEESAENKPARVILQGGDGSGSGVIQFPTHRTRRTARQQDEDFIESEVAAVVAKQEKAVAEAEARVERAKRLNTGRMAEIVAVARTMPPEVFENNPVYENMTPLERRAFHSIMEADEELAFERSVLNDMRKSLESAKASSTTDRIVKKNLQDATPAERPSTHAPAEGKPGSATNPHVVPMYYKMKPQEVREDLRSRYPNGTTTAQLIADGLRTATTRRPQQGVLPGHYIKFPGVPGLYRVVKFEKVDLKTTAGKKQWAQREGWDTDAAMSAFPDQVRDGAIQMVFERVDRKPLKPSAQTTALAKQLSAAERQAIIDEARKTLGPGVKVAFEPFIQGTNGQEWSGDWVDGLIRISIGAQDHAGVGRHESIHQLFKWLRQHGADNIESIIENAAKNPAVQRQLHRLLSDHPNAIAQLSDPEEAAAYLYQFWKAGQVKLGEKTEGLFQRIAKALRNAWQHIAKALGSVDAKNEIQMRRDLRKAEALLGMFSEGAFADGDKAVLQSLNAKIGEQMKQEAAKGFMERFTQNDVLRKVAYTAGSVLEDTGNPYFKQIARMFHTPEGGKLGKQALFEATAQVRAQKLNALNKILIGKDPEDVKLALKYLQSREDSRNIHDPVTRKIVEDIRAFLVDMHNYMLERGVQRWDEKTKKWVPVPAISHNYFPVNWSVDKIAADPQAFIKKLMEVHAQELEAIAREANNEVANGKDAGELSASKTVQGRAVTAEDVAYAITQRIITSSGAADISESTSSLGITPFAKSVNKRSLWWLDHSKFTDFMSDDLVQIMTNYTVQVVKRGEYVSRFGNEGEVLQELATKAYVHELLGEGGVAKAEAKLKEMEVDWQRRKAAARANGQSDDIPKPTLRQAAESLVPQKERDARTQETLKKIEIPVRAIMAGEGTLGRDINPNLRKVMAGVITYQNMRLMALSLFSSLIDPLGMLIRGGTLNDSWRGFVRGVREIFSQVRGKEVRDDMAALAEQLGTVDAGTYLDALGQTYSSLFVQGKLHKINNKIFHWNGMEAWNRAMRIQATAAAVGFIKRHLSTPTDQSERYLKDELGLDPKLKDQFMKDGELDYMNEAVKAAIMRWVDGAILRPNAMQRPIVASDPHYALFYHLKQFAYSFHKTILRRAAIEAKHGNYAPSVALFTTYIPVMVAADAVKEMLVPGDDPDWMKGGLGDYFSHGFLRANLMGVPQLGYEAISNPFKDPTRSVESAAGLFGPAVSQATGILLAPLTEKHTAGGEFINALPGAVIANRMTR